MEIFIPRFQRNNEAIKKIINNLNTNISSSNDDLIDMAVKIDIK